MNNIKATLTSAEYFLPLDVEIWNLNGPPSGMMNTSSRLSGTSILPPRTRTMAHPGGVLPANSRSPARIQTMDWWKAEHTFEFSVLMRMHYLGNWMRTGMCWLQECSANKRPLFGLYPSSVWCWLHDFGDADISEIAFLCIRSRILIEGIIFWVCSCRDLVGLFMVLN